MAEWQTCFDGCRCSECRQRRSDYMYMSNYKFTRDIEDSYCGDPEYSRLNNAMDNLNYDHEVQKALRKKYSTGGIFD